MTVCPTCSSKHFDNDSPLIKGNPSKNTGVYKNTCKNGHVSYYSEVTHGQTENIPEQ